MTDIVFRYEGSWMPLVIREDDGQLLLQVPVDFNRGYDIREFTFRITEEQLAVLRADLTRHVLLWCALEAVCEKGELDTGSHLVDQILGRPEAEVESMFGPRDHGKTRRLIAYGADPALFDRGELFAAMTGPHVVPPDYDLQWEYDANRDRARRGITLTSLDVAVLKYCNRYLHGATLAMRRPDAIDPGTLPQVLAVVAAAEESEAKLTTSYPNLGADTIAAVTSLVQAERR